MTDDQQILEMLKRIDARTSSIEATLNGLSTSVGELREDFKDLALRTTLMEVRIGAMQKAIDKLTFQSA